MKLFNRQARVTISRATPNAFFTATLNAIVITDLRIAFKVVKTLGKEPNTCEVTISNLSATTRAALQGLPLQLELAAGYEGSSLKRLFIGDLLYSDSERKGATWETKIQVGTGARAFNEARVSQTFAANVDALTIGKAAAAKMNVTLPPNIDAIAGLSKRFSAGVSLSGPASRELTRVLDAAGLEWSIQDTGLQVLAPEQATPNSAFVVSQENGMIGSPAFGAPTHDGKPPTLKIKNLLYPDLSPGGQVQVQSVSINGKVFRIEKVEHEGDTHGDPWNTDVETRASS